MATEGEIKKMKRGQLNELAAELKLNPDDYKRADDLRSAIFKQLNQASDVESDAESVDTKKTTKKAVADDTEKKPKQPKPNPTRPRLVRQSKRYQEAHKLVEKDKLYPINEAIELIAKTSTVKFDAAVEMHINLGVDPKQADQLVRGTTVLPHGSGKSLKVAALAPESEHAAIKKAGADSVGNQDLLDKIAKGKIDFDILVAHPDVMKGLSKLAKVLGPKGLMPSPKSGTVTSDVAKTVHELKSGRIEFRVDRYGIIHQIIGRASFKPSQLIENNEALMAAIFQSKPSTLKGSYLKKATLSTSMGPGIKLDLASLHN